MEERLPESLSCGIRISPVMEPFFNLAWEEWLFRALPPEQLLLLFYRNTPAIVIGRNQNPWRECRVAALPAAGLTLARRFSGGGTVYHDPGNLNFSFVMPRRLYAPDRFLALVLKGLQRCGIAATANARHGLDLKGRKFSGSAFMLTGAKALHHGTLLLNSDLAQLQWALTGDDSLAESKAVASVPAPVMNLAAAVPGLTHDRVIAALSAAFAAAAGRPITTEIISPTALSAQPEFSTILARHSSDDWRFRRTPPFSRQFQVTAGALTLDVQMRIENGQVAAVTVAPLHLPPGLTAWLTRQLSGRPYDGPALTAAVNVPPPTPDWLPLTAALTHRLADVFKVSP